MKLFKLLTVIVLSALSALAMAGGTLGKISTVNYSARTVTIDGMVFPVADDAVESSEASPARKLDLSRFRGGDVVSFQVKDGKITGMARIKNLKDIPS